MPAARTPIEQRRGSKPLVEKKRRARINHSLAELQALVVDTKKKQGSKQSRVEKADILEMTVRHLQAMQNHQRKENSESRTDKFNSGYMECVDEVRRFLAASKYKNSGVLGERLTSHLMVRLPRVQPATSSTTPAAPMNNDKDDDDDGHLVRTKVVETPDDTPSCSSSEDSMESILQRDFTAATSELSSVYPCYLPNGQLAYVVPDKDNYHLSNKQLLVTPPAHQQIVQGHHPPSKDFFDDGRRLCFAPNRSKVIYFNGPVDLSRDDSATMWRPW